MLSAATGELTDTDSAGEFSVGEDISTAKFHHKNHSQLSKFLFLLHRTKICASLTRCLHRCSQWPHFLHVSYTLTVHQTPTVTKKNPINNSLDVLSKIVRQQVLYPSKNCTPVTKNPLSFVSSHCSSPNLVQVFKSLRLVLGYLVWLQTKL